MPNSNSFEQQIANLEMRIAFQDDTIEQLNTVVCDLQNEVSDLQFQLRTIVNKFKSLQTNDLPDPNSHEPPPHY